MNYNFFNQNYLDYLLNVSTAIGSLHQEFWDGTFFPGLPVPEFLMKGADGS